MPVTHETWLKTDLKRPITVQPLHGLLFSADNQGDKVGFEVYDDGTPVTLSGVITGYIIKNNGETVVVSGSFDGNRAWIICPANAYDAIGPIYIAIKNRASTASTAITTTLGMCTTYVERTATGEIVTPTYKIVDAATIANMITQMETATNAATAAASSANTAAAAANTAAGRTENMDATATTLAPGSAATANVSTVSGHYRIAIGVPKGDIGPVAEITGTPTSTYQVGDDGTTIPTGTWLDNIPTVPQGSFLWTRTIITWNNGQTTTIYSPSRQGRDGSGSVSSVNDVSPDSNGNVNLGEIVYKVNNVSPDSSGNVALPIDSAPTAGSTNPVTSGGIKTALDGKVNKAGDTMSGTLILTNNSGPRNSTSPQIGFYFDGNDCVANIQYTSNKHFCFIERDASDNSIREQFYLPIITSASGTQYYDILTSKPNSGSLYYGAGETYSTSTDMMICGHVTSGTTVIQLGMWLPKSLEKISSISVTNLVGAIRGTSGYINNWGANTNILTQSGITVDAVRTFPNGIRLHIGNTSEFTNVTNNTPVAFSGKITLSFS
jgi:hypothetical protein